MSLANCYVCMDVGSMLCCERHAVRIMEEYRWRPVVAPLVSSLCCGGAAMGKFRRPPRPAFPLHSVAAIKAGSYSRPGPPRPFGTGGVDVRVFGRCGSPAAPNLRSSPVSVTAQTQRVGFDQ